MSNNIPHIEKLKGRENYESWKFAARAYLEVSGLWKYVEGTGDAKDEDKATKARAILVLLVDQVNYVHIQDAKNAQAVWDNLKKAFDDSGLLRRVGLLRELVSTRLETCVSMEDYVNKIVTTAHKLNGAGMQIDDAWIGTLLLAGLTEDFKPMIMAIESSSVGISSDLIKTKLLQEVRSNHGASSSVAVFAKKKKQSRNNVKNREKKKDVKCYGCGGIGHYKNKCPSAKSEADHKQKSILVSSCFTSNELTPGEWYIDSGASKHMTCVAEWMINSKNSTGKVTIANEKKLTSNMEGDVRLKLKINNRVVDSVVKDVLFVPELCTNLLSVSQLVKKGFKIEFNAMNCTVYDKNEILVQAKLCDGLYQVLQQASSSSLMVSKSCSLQKLWHQRLGHLGYDNLLKLKTNGLVQGINFSEEEREICEVCVKGKHARHKFNPSSSRATELLELIHSDLCGPISVDTFGGSKFFMTFLDDHSRKVFVYFMRHKSEALSKFKEFRKMVELQTGKRIKMLRTDNGKEYVNNSFTNYLASVGIVHQLTTPYTPQQNGMAERLNRTLVERASCMLFEAKLNVKFWGEAINTAAYLINRSPCSTSDKTPEEIWSNKKPNLSHIKVFGCKVMIHVPKQKRKKFEQKSREGVMVGYSSQSKAYRVFNLEKTQVVVSRDVVFLENERCEEKVCTDNKFINHFYLFKEDTNEVEEVLHSVSPINDVADGTIDLADDNIYSNDSITSEFQGFPPNDISEVAEVQQTTLESDSSLCDCFNSDHDVQDVDDSEYIPPDNISVDSVTYPRVSARTPKPIVRKDFVSYLIHATDDPQTVEEAMGSPDANEWKSAMKREYEALQETNTWVMVDLPSDRKKIQCKWVFKKKSDTLGNVNQYKARLVVKGCSQRKGIDYEETFSPVVRYTSIRLLISLAVRYDLDIDQMDVTTAFLHGNLEEPIYMEQPKEFFDGTNRVCLLKKSLYGLKQASRIWNQRLDSALKTFGLKNSKYDYCIYYNCNGGKVLIVAVYVDDLMLFSNDVLQKKKLKSFLMSHFKMKDLGQARQVLGMRITRSKNRKLISIDQSHYIQKLLGRFNMDQCNAVRSPVDMNQKLTSDFSPKNEATRKEMECVPYQAAVGSLLFVAQVSRPDIQYAVSSVSRFNNNPGKSHWLAVKRIMRYLKGTIDFKLTYSGETSNCLEGFCDSDWASDMLDRRSTTGYVFKSQAGAVSWSSKKQPTIALSTTEAEYMSMSAATQEALWLKGLRDELFEEHNQGPVKIHCDNVGAIKLGEKTAFSPRTKHIDVRHHFLREKVNQKLVEFSYVATKYMVADSLTKAVSPEKHSWCSSGMNIIGTSKCDASGGVEKRS